MQGLCIKNRLFFLYGFSSFQCQVSRNNSIFLFCTGVWNHLWFWRLNHEKASIIVSLTIKLWDFAGLHLGYSHPGDLTVSKRTGTSDRIKIQFRTFNHLSRPDSFVKLFETLCLCLAQGNECLGQIWNRNLISLMRYWVILNQKWISILQLVPGLFRDHLDDWAE
jgi:hypothetical protein